MRYEAHLLRKGEARVFSAALLALGTALMLTNPWFTAVDDECAIIDRAARPAAYTVRLYLSGVGEHEHPPLYDLILHGWLLLTHGQMDLLRVPAIVFYLLGIWFLASAARRLGGDRAAMWVLILTLLWPFGFHFGRVAAWYSFCFLLVSLLTWAYLTYLERPTLGRWTGVLLCALALVYSNYFGWALLGLLGLDMAIRDPQGILRHWKRLAGGGVLLAAAYAPVLRVFLRELHNGINVKHSFLAMVLPGIYNLYCAFTSESVAPWFWALGVPAGIAIAVSLLVMLRCTPWPARRFLIYFLSLLAAMTILGIAETKRLLFVAPWLILPLAAGLCALPRTSIWRRAFLAALIVVAGIGWYGIFARRLYAAPHWVAPWREVAEEAGSTARSGGVVIGNNTSFFFYLTYLLPEESPAGGPPEFRGLLPNSTRRRGVYDPQQWLAEGRPLGSTVLLVEGLHYGTSEGPTEEVEQFLAARCRLTRTRRMVHDRGAKWKERFAPKTAQVPWRIHVYTYACPRGNVRQAP